MNLLQIYKSLQKFCILKHLPPKNPINFVINYNSIVYFTYLSLKSPKSCKQIC